MPIDFPDNFFEIRVRENKFPKPIIEKEVGKISDIII